MGQIKLYSARACPFAHRTRLVLSHKQLPFELLEVDLQNKPVWFDRKVSAYGKVPAIEHGEARIWESAVINEYLDESFPKPSLLPHEPGRRAVARIWIDYANTRFAPAWGKLLRAPNAADEGAAKKELLESAAFIEAEGLARHSDAGPFFLGAAPSLVDFAFYPWFERWAALEHYRKVGVPAELTRLRRWQEALRALPAVQEQANATEYYVERYAQAVAPRAQAVA